MIRSIAAIDSRLGLATDKGIPWHVPADVEHFRSAIASSAVLMGYCTYREFVSPLPDSTNYVATRRGSELRDGFVAVDDVRSLLTDELAGDLWVIGGAVLYASTLPLVHELALTRVDGDFDCTKFFPQFEGMFELVTDEAVPPTEGVPGVRFQTWQRASG
ncbi:MAG TPA: dihydrofolate reductase [Acidimicrobiales bacterium]|nr:dihydrofolate reductase [Acidimicrobiales bacterium]